MYARHGRKRSDKKLELNDQVRSKTFARPRSSQAERKRLRKAEARRASRRCSSTSRLGEVGGARHASALQIHGGNGYTVEYGAEKLLRDAMVFPIYEGTSQIQALMAMKDTLGGHHEGPPTSSFKRPCTGSVAQRSPPASPLERRIAKLQCAQPRRPAAAHPASTATDKMRTLGEDCPMAQWSQAFFKDWDPKRDFSYAMLHAEHLTRLLTDVAICEALLAQARKHPERIEVLERYLERAEPRARHQHDLIVNTGQGLLDRLARRLTGGHDSADAAQ